MEPITPKQARKLARRMELSVERIEDDMTPLYDVPLVHERELTQVNEDERFLGEGGYCLVQKVIWKGKTLARKQLKPTLGPHHHCVGTRDLATEGALLAGLQHPNIIKVYGVSQSDLQACIMKEEGAFILLDCLDSTLGDRIRQWKREDEGMPPSSSPCPTTDNKTRTLARQSSGWWSNLFVNGDASQCAVWNGLVRQRVPKLLQVAQALAYLHKRGVMYRDLKPDNIGLDGDGNIRLLDFGLATTSTSSSELAGSRRYMAPEVIRPNAWYTKSVDVYSFGILLYYVLTLEKPFAKYSGLEHYEKVVEGGERPEIPEWWPKSMQRLVGQCWSAYPSERPDMQSIVRTLQRIVRQGERQAMAMEKKQQQQQRNNRVVPVQN